MAASGPLRHMRMMEARLNHIEKKMGLYPPHIRTHRIAEKAALKWAIPRLWEIAKQELQNPTENVENNTESR